MAQQALTSPSLLTLERDRDGVVRWGMPPDVEPVDYCRCGREMRKLNVASEWAACIGCGHVEENCRCE